jgi:hypothetical protein
MKKAPQWKDWGGVPISMGRRTEWAMELVSKLRRMPSPKPGEIEMTYIASGDSIVIGVIDEWGTVSIEDCEVRRKINIDREDWRWNDPQV